MRAMVATRTHLLTARHLGVTAPVTVGVDLIADVNRSLAGWANYFRHGCPR
jgi:hypothetical protein